MVEARKAADTLDQVQAEEARRAANTLDQETAESETNLKEEEKGEAREKEARAHNVAEEAVETAVSLEAKDSETKAKTRILRVRRRFEISLLVVHPE